MDNIRKISVGPDYKGSSMHYIVGQKVVGDTSEIELIRFDEVKNSIKIFIRNDNNESLLWKEFNFTMPIAIEYNINF